MAGIEYHLECFDGEEQVVEVGMDGVVLNEGVKQSEESLLLRLRLVPFHERLLQHFKY